MSQQPPVPPPVVPPDHTNMQAVPTTATTLPATTTTTTAPQQQQQQQQNTALIVGLHVVVVAAAAATASQQQGDARTALAAARQDGFDFVTTQLPFATTTASNSNSSNTVRADMSLESKWWRTSVVGMTTSGTTTGDDDEHYTYLSSSSSSSSPLAQQLQWAWHMNLPAVCLPPLPVPASTTATTTNSTSQRIIAQYAAMVATLSQQSLQEAGPSFQLWVPVTVVTTTGSGGNPVDDNLLMLQTWQSVSAMAHAPSNVGLLINLVTTSSSSSSSSNKTGAASQQQQQQQQQQLYSHLLLLLHNLMACGPIHAIQLQTNQFLINKRGYPTLSKLHQRLVEFILLRIGRSVRWLLVQQQQQQQHNSSSMDTDENGSGATTAVAANNNNNNNNLQHLPATSRGMSGCLPYWQYIQHIRQRSTVTAALDSAEAAMEQDYLDVLQKPLQPLKDHLLFSTYETFEKDPVKYQQYQVAVERALLAKHERYPNLKTITVFVVGAGRGPLVSRVIQAYQVYCQHVLLLQSQQQQQQPKPMTVVCVEKNPSAVFYLRSKARHDPLWQLVPVLIVQGDLRHLKSEQCHNMTADIVVSELLGSFGCNELSPECLNAFLQGPLAKPHTDSIPCKYVSHLAVGSSAHLHNQVRQQAFYPTDDQSGVVGLRTAFETPYVVRTHAASQMQVEQDCWVFDHSSSATVSTTMASGNQYAFLEFGPSISLCGNGYGKLLPAQVEQQQPSANGTTTATQQQHQQPSPTQTQFPAATQPWVLTGLLGTFTAQLFDNVFISTAPRHFSVGMFSWFPLYFPLQEALHVPAGAVVQTHIWRKVDEATNRVWYEWSATVKQGTAVLATTPVHNVNGRSYHVAL